METYLLVNIFILSLVLLVLRIVHVSKAQLITLIALIVLTAIGDSAIIGLGIVSYDSTKILGLHIGLIPIEDFFYAIAAVMIIPVVWHKLEKRHD
jgi:lycopene cyclase domain-containing protein